MDVWKRSFQVINNGIDAERYRFNYTVSQDKRRELGFTEDNFVIGHVGRFAAQKTTNFLWTYLKVFTTLILSLNCYLLEMAS